MSVFDSAAGRELPLPERNEPQLQAASGALPQPTRVELDAALEREIDTAHRAYLRAVELDDTPSIRECFDVMAALCEQRSPQKIAELEARLPEPWRS